MKKQSLCLVMVVIITSIFMTIYGVGQQILRMAANDPQIQLAQDTATQLNSSPLPASASNKVNMAKSLAPFIIVYDEQGRPLTGNGYLNNALPKAPIGMLEASKTKDYNAVTWEPTSGVRIASVTVKADHYYVLSGRSLSEVEKRISHVLNLVGFGWVISMLCVGASYLYFRKPGRK